MWPHKQAKFHIRSLMEQNFVKLSLTHVSSCFSEGNCQFVFSLHCDPSFGWNVWGKGSCAIQQAGTRPSTAVLPRWVSPRRVAVSPGFHNLPILGEKGAPAEGTLVCGYSWHGLAASKPESRNPRKGPSLRPQSALLPTLAQQAEQVDTKKKRYSEHMYFIKYLIILVWLGKSLNTYSTM